MLQCKLVTRSSQDGPTNCGQVLETQDAAPSPFNETGAVNYVARG